MGDVNHEPTMEEILASIKKIIAEDGDAVASQPDARSGRQRPELEPEAEIEDVLELTDQVEPEAAQIEPAEPVEPEEEAAEPIASDEAIKASQATLAVLSAITNPAIPADPDNANPLEGLVREMLRPMLKEWLDDNLPQMVEEMVAREIARIAAHRN